jgi:Acetyltransferases, including N-acetylases of ribosomal proteins
MKNEIIHLRALEPEDLEVLYKWENDSSLWLLGSTLSPYSRYVLKEYISESYKGIYEQKQLRLMIVLNEGNQTVGMIDLYDFDPHNNRAGVGILLDEAFQRKGYASMALDLLISYAFSFIKIHQLYAYIPETNVASISLFQKSGFEESGFLKQWNVGTDGYDNVFVFQKIND